jgi:hypothetical protein
MFRYGGGEGEFLHRIFFRRCELEGLGYRLRRYVGELEVVGRGLCCEC